VSNQYEFVSHWRVDGTCGEVADILADPLAFVRWWPSVYLDVEELRPPDARGLGRRVRFHTKGWLPYTILWESEIVESRYPHGFTIVANGGFEGRGVWTFEQDGPAVDVKYDWRLRAEKPLLRNLSFLLRPLFEANHRWAMAQGEESLKLELLRRRAASDVAPDRNRCEARIAEGVVPMAMRVHNRRELAGEVPSEEDWLEHADAPSARILRWLRPLRPGWNASGSSSASWRRSSRC